MEKVLETIQNKLRRKLGDYWYLGEITSAKVAIYLDIDVAEAQKYLNKMVRDGIIRRSGQESARERLNSPGKNVGRPCTIYSFTRSYINKIKEQNRAT